MPYTPTKRCGLILFLVAVWLLPGCAATTTDWLNNPLKMADQTFRFDEPDVFTAGRASNGRVIVRDGAMVPMMSASVLRQSPPSWHWQTREVETAFPFTQLLPSWNVMTPQHSGVKLMVRTRDLESAQWSPWLYVGSWGETSEAGKEVVAFDFGEVNIDYLVLSQPADAFELRVVFENDDIEHAEWPALHKLVAVVSGPVDGVKSEDHATYIPQTVQVESYEGGINLNVPYLTQQALPASMRSRTCSPTSTSMVLAFRGIDEQTQVHADRIFDEEYDIYGNWGRAVARAGELGLDAELARFRTWQQVRETLESGQPIVASIRFGKGEFPSNPMSSTAGHLIVIRGLTEQGDAIVNDPAFSEGGEGIVYKKEELARAWIGHGGVGYLIAERASQE